MEVVEIIGEEQQYLEHAFNQTSSKSTLCYRNRNLCRYTYQIKNVFM